MKKNLNFALICFCLSSSIALALLLAQQQQQVHAHPSGGLPTFVSRASDSISALLTSDQTTNKNNVGTQQQQQLAATVGGGDQQQQQQQLQFQQRALTNSSATPSIVSPAALNLQAHLSAIQSQAQRQINQLNGLVLSGANQLVNSPLAAHAANLTGVSNKYGNVLEVLSNVGRAIQSQIMNSASNQNIQIITSQPNSAPAAASGTGTGTGAGAGISELANSKKNEYHSIVVNENQQLNSAAANDDKTTTNSSLSSSIQVPPPSSGSVVGPNNYREQGEQLRQEIVRRAGQLQQVVASSMEVLKNNGDLIVRRLLEQLNNRLDQAKSKADKIINEPATNEMAIKALTTINQGLNNLNNIITNIVNRLDINGKGDISGQLAAAAASQRVAFGPSSQTGLLADPNRFKLNFHQIGQQFSSAINAVQQQQRQFQQHQLQQQQQQQLNNLKAVQ